jgi:carboxyl-terminal processing protease
MGMMTGKRLSVIAALLTTIGLGICLRGTVSTVHDRNSRFSGDTGASNSSLLASDRYYDFATASHLASAALPQAGVAEDGRHRFHSGGPQRISQQSSVVAVDSSARRLEKLISRGKSLDGRIVLHTASLSSDSQSDGDDGVIPSHHREMDLSNATRNEFFREDSEEPIDPFRRSREIPAPKERDENSLIHEALTLRYQNPVTLRAVRAMSGSQAVQLFNEVSLKIDERALNPTSYSVRVRRGLRNLSAALSNEAFLSGMRLTKDSRDVEEFRIALRRLEAAADVQSFSQTRAVLQAAMRQAENVSGLASAVVAFEFTSASIDSLDKFSGLEIEEPELRNGAKADELIRTTDVLDEHIVGIGLEVREHPEGLLVVRPLRDGPAAEAGVEAGDIIHSINGQDLQGMKMGRSMDLLKGPSGSQMKMQISRRGQSLNELVLVRRQVRVWTVHDAKLLDGTEVGYFSLSRFSQNSKSEVDEALDTLYSRGMKSLIVDVRGNPGGLLTTSVEVSDDFVACGTIVSTKGRLSSDNMILEAAFANTWKVPMVVLLDGDSASASEIFAAAIQDNKRGLIVGTRSYGKGTVQTHFPLNAISGDLRLTTAEFYSPLGRRMAGEGVTPDIEVEDQDGVLNGDDVLAEALQIARSPMLKDMANAAGACRSAKPPAVRSSSLDDIKDPKHPGMTIL